MIHYEGVWNSIRPLSGTRFLQHCIRMQIFHDTKLKQQTLLVLSASMHLAKMSRITNQAISGCVICALVSCKRVNLKKDGKTNLGDLHSYIDVTTLNKEKMMRQRRRRRCLGIHLHYMRVHRYSERRDVQSCLSVWAVSSVTFCSIRTQSPFPRFPRASVFLHARWYGGPLRADRCGPSDGESIGRGISTCTSSGSLFKLFPF